MEKNFVFLVVSGLILMLCGIGQADNSQDFVAHYELDGSAEDAIRSYSALPEPNPVVKIRANGFDDSMELNVGETLNLSISLNAGDHENEGADWWVIQLTPDGKLYYFDLKTLSMAEMGGVLIPTLQYGLVSFGDIQILSLSELQRGTHFFYFGIDLSMNGDLDIGSLYFDYLQVNVKDGGTQSNYTNSLGQRFVLLPAGTFTMGSPSGEPGRYSDETQHQVTLTRPFYMQQTEVTQAQWKAVMGSNPSRFVPPFYDDCPTCPVEQVTWDEVQAFISKMNTRGEGAYSLPTEAQWEYAARAGSTTAFANGDITELSCGVADPNLNAIGWYCYNSNFRTHPSAQKAPNAWGLYDMHGNVSEWCQDWYDEIYYDSGAITDPTGPSSGWTPVLRGGAFEYSPRNCRSADRDHNQAYARNYQNGFRLMRQP